MLDLAAVKARSEAATPGPWQWNLYSRILARVPVDHVANVNDEGFPGLADVCHMEDIPPRDSGGDQLRSREAMANAIFIAHAREDVPALVAEVEQLQREVERLRRRTHELQEAHDKAYATLKREADQMRIELSAWDITAQRAYERLGHKQFYGLSAADALAVGRWIDELDRMKRMYEADVRTVQAEREVEG